MLLYSKTAGPRLHYLVQFLGAYFKTEATVTSDADQFNAYPGVRINYTLEPSGEASLHIAPSDLLFRQGTEAVPVTVFSHPRGFKAFFATNCSLGFDLLAAVFYLVSRYEEYGPHAKDSYGRYAHTESLAYREGFLHLPLVNTWLEHLRQQVLVVFPDAGWTAPTYRFLPTYDIDIAWSYRGKGLARNAGGLLRSIFTGRWHQVRNRAQVLLGARQDPYDSYHWMERLHAEFGLHPLYFVHVGLKPHRFDKNISPHHPSFRKLVRNLAGQYAIGLHPSWRSGGVQEVLAQEKHLLEHITGTEVHSSRQHYIRLHLPETYESLIQAGIREDYSMGYGSINGFRASIATPFFFYNLAKEEVTDLLLHPFCYMDANSFFEQGQTAEETLKEFLHYHREIRNVGGTYISIWHNTFLGTDPLYRGWREVYQEGVAAILGE